MIENTFTASIEYFPEEGKKNLRPTLKVAFESAIERGINTIVIFTGIGEGPELAIREFLTLTPFRDIRIIAVTFPSGQRFKDGKEAIITPERLSLFAHSNVPLIRAHLPFSPISAHFRSHGILGQDLTLVGNALSIFGGSMSLCVQAATMACDAGYVEVGYHVISMTSDTAILVRTCPTAQLLTDFIVREVLCKPVFMTIGKGEKVYKEPKQPPTLEATPNRAALPPK